MDPMDFPEKLASLLARRNLSQKEVGILIGVDQARISEWITRKAKRRPPLDVAYRLARVLEVPVEYLADDEVDDPPPPMSDDERTILRVARKIGIEEALSRLSLAPGTEFKAAGGVDLDPSENKPGRKNKRAKGPDVPRGGK